MTEESEWCKGRIKERARSKEELLNKKSYAQQERDTYDKHSSWDRAPLNQSRPGRSKQKKPRGPGRKRPRVRCSECDKLLTVKAMDLEPSQPNSPELVWTLPAHKPKTKRKKKQRQKK